MIGAKTHVILSTIVLSASIFYINEMISAGWMMIIIILACLSQQTILLRECVLNVKEVSE